MQLDIVLQNLFIPSLLCTRLASFPCRLSPYPMHDSVLVLQKAWLGLNLISSFLMNHLTLHGCIIMICGM